MTYSDPTLAEVRWLLRELRSNGWHHSVSRDVYGCRTHQWRRGADLVEAYSTADTGLFSDVSFGRFGGEAQATVDVAWIAERGVFDLHRLGEVLGVFDDRKTRGLDNRLLAWLIASSPRPPVESDWMRHRLGEIRRRPGRPDDVEAIRARLLEARDRAAEAAR